MIKTNIKLIVFSILGILSSSSLMAQNLGKEVFKTFSDGTPEIIYYYSGENNPMNRVKKEEFNSNGDKILEENHSKGKLHGKRLEFYNFDGSKRVVSTENNYHKGILHGEQISWIGSGIIKAELYYNLGLPEGKQVEWYRKDKLRFELNYKDGKPEGKQKEWYSNGTQKYDLNFVNGKLEGVQRWWNFDQTLVEEIWNNGVLTVSTNKELEKIVEEFSFSLDANSISLDPKYNEYYMYKVLNKRTHFNSNGNRTKEYDFTEGKYYKEWYPNGELKKEGPGKVGRETGIWIEYHENGQNAAKGNYHNGLKNEHWMFWNKEGLLTDEKEFDLNNLRDWKIYTWHSNGIKKSEGKITRIHKDGNWTYWTETGEIWRQEVYEPGPYSGNRPFIKEFTEWNADGNVKLKGEDKYGTHFYYSASGNKVAELKLFYMKTRGRHEYNEDGEIKVNPDYEAKRGGGTIGDYSFSEGFPLELFHYYNDDQLESITRFCKKCITENPEFAFTGTLDGNQEGWYENGESRYIYFFIKGCITGPQKEWYIDGSPRFDISYGANEFGSSMNPVSDCHTHVSSGVYYTESGKQIIYQQEWDPKAQKKAYKSGDVSLMKSKEKETKILQIESESYLPTFLK